MDARPNPDPFLQVSSVVNWFSFFCPQESTVFSPLHSPKIPVKSRVTIGVLDASFHFGRFQVKNNRKWSKNNGYPESFASGRAITNKNFNKHDQNFGTWIWYWLALVSSTIASLANLFKCYADVTHLISLISLRALLTNNLGGTQTEHRGDRTRLGRAKSHPTGPWCNTLATVNE